MIDYIQNRLSKKVQTKHGEINLRSEFKMLYPDLYKTESRANEREAEFERFCSYYLPSPFKLNESKYSVPHFERQMPYLAQRVSIILKPGKV
jgi:hypothetical protein